MITPLNEPRASLQERDHAPVRRWARLRSFRGGWILALSVAACAAPSTLPLDVDASWAAWAERGSEGALEAALNHADVAQTAIRRPDAIERLDPSNDAFWEACALAWNPSVRATRNEVLALRQELRSAGAPGPIGLRAVDHSFGGDDTLVETIATFDLIGLLGLGPSEAAKELQGAQVVRALALHEEALWAARIEVERARVQLSATRARLERLSGLEAEAMEDEVRISILAQSGREAPASVEAAAARVAALERQRSVQKAALAAGRRRLEFAAGLPAGHIAPESVHATYVQQIVERDLADPRWQSIHSETHPVLRRARFDFAVAEANIRAVAAEAWPGVRLGPHLSFGPASNIGGVLQLSMPWPSAWQGRLAAAERRREGARQAFEDAWLDLDQRAVAAARAHGLARQRTVGSTLSVDLATQRLWSAARARYRNADAPLMNWIDALEIRTNSLMLIVDDAEAVALAWLDVLEARGPGAESATAPSEVAP